LIRHVVDEACTEGVLREERALVEQATDFRLRLLSGLGDPADNLAV
jgi:hypothetical protein